MKDILSINIIPVSQIARQGDFDMLIVFTKNRKIPALPKLKQSLIHELKRHAAMEDYQVTAGSKILFYPSTDSPAPRITMVELGNNKTTPEIIFTICKSLKTTITRHNRCAAILHEKSDLFTISKHLVTAFYSANFTLNEFKSSSTDPKKMSMTIFSQKNIKTSVTEGSIIGRAMTLSRYLGNLPANILTPNKFSDIAHDTAQHCGLRAQTIEEKEMKEKGLNGILAISQGSHEAAKLIILEHNPKAKKTIALVGKGITFDSGGISMKQPKDMDEMKFDMCGGADVLAVLQAAAELKIPYHVVGIIAAAENLPSGTAIKPGDVITTYSGKTVEILNTDAEGRMVLADALTYAQKHFNPKAIIDIATLTSAVMVAFGGKYVAAFGNNTKLNNSLQQAADASGENIWFLPLPAKIKNELKGKIADLSNIIKGKPGDALTAPVFLQQFVDKKIPWVHLDIAGSAWNSEGATGVTIPTLIELLKSGRI